jgi:hypothetical protein
VIDAVVATKTTTGPVEARTQQRWRTAVGSVINGAIHVLRHHVLDALAVSRQERAFLTSPSRGYGGLRAVSAIAARHGHTNPTTCLLAWAYQLAPLVAARPP